MKKKAELTVLYEAFYKASKNDVILANHLSIKLCTGMLIVSLCIGLSLVISKASLFL